MPGAGEGEQLCGQPVRRLQARDDGGQTFAHAHRVGFAQCVFRLREQHGQRRAQLVRRIGQKLALRLRKFGIAMNVVVDRIDQRADFGGHVRGIERAEVVRCTYADAACQAIERPQRDGYAEPQQRGADRHQRCIAQQRAAPHRLLQRAPRLDGFCHLNDDARRQPRLIERLGHGGHAYGLVVVRRVVEERGVVLQPRHGQRQIVVAGQRGFGRLARQGLESDAVIDIALRGGFEHGQRHVRHVDLNLPALDRHAVLDGAHRAEQRAIVRAISRATQRLVRRDDVDGQHTYQSRQQQPEQREFQAARQPKPGGPLHHALLLPAAGASPSPASSR